jgi:hypothetical protein
MLKRFEKPMPTFALTEPKIATAREIVIEASPLESFVTAAGRFATAEEPLSLPPDVFASLHGTTCFVRSVVRATGEVLATVRISA